MRELLVLRRKKIISYAFKLTLDTDEAEDLFQDLCLRLLRVEKRLSFLPTDEQEKIAFASIRNLFLDKKRKRLTRPLVVTDFIPDRCLENSDPIPQSVAKQMLSEIFSSDDHHIRAAIMLATGYKTSEIAMSLGVTCSTVSGLVRYGRAKLRKQFPEYLQDAGIELPDK